MSASRRWSPTCASRSTPSSPSSTIPTKRRSPSNCCCSGAGEAAPVVVRAGAKRRFELVRFAPAQTLVVLPLADFGESQCVAVAKVDTANDVWLAKAVELFLSKARVRTARGAARKRIAATFETHRRDVRRDHADPSPDAEPVDLAEADDARPAGAWNGCSRSCPRKAWRCSTTRRSTTKSSGTTTSPGRRS